MVFPKLGVPNHPSHGSSFFSLASFGDLDTSISIPPNSSFWRKIAYLRMSCLTLANTEWHGSNVEQRQLHNLHKQRWIKLIACILYYILAFKCLFCIRSHPHISPYSKCCNFSSSHRLRLWPMLFFAGAAERATPEASWHRCAQPNHGGPQGMKPDIQLDRKVGNLGLPRYVSSVVGHVGEQLNLKTKLAYPLVQ